MSRRSWGTFPVVGACLLLAAACGRPDGGPSVEPTAAGSTRAYATEWDGVELEEISDDGRHLRLAVATSPCLGNPEFDRVSEEPSRIVIHLVRTSAPPSEGQPCLTVQRILHVEVAINEPLADRTIEVRTETS